MSGLGQSSDFDAAARSLSGEMHGPELPQDWYVYWWRRDGTAHGARGRGLSLSAATRLAREIRDGEVTP